jgi:hypothetical protein
MKILLGIALGILLVAGGVVIVVALLGPDPPAEPPEREPEDAKRRARLFKPATWRRAQLGTTVENRVPGAPMFHRPLEVQPLAEEQIMPAPRNIHGVNREV